MTNRYKPKNIVTLTASFRVKGIAADPDTVTLKIKPPQGDIETYTYANGEIIRFDEGIYYKDYLPVLDFDVDTEWFYEFSGTGIVATDYKSFIVEKTVF